MIRNRRESKRANPRRRVSPPFDYSPILLLNPSDSGSLRTPCPPASKPAGRRGITPAFGYGAPHPSAGGTLILLIHALPSAHYGGVRLPTVVHHRLQLLAFPMRTRAARVTSAAGRPWDLPVPVQEASAHARVCDHAGRPGAR
jgi:hypothetical protein